MPRTVFCFIRLLACISMGFAHVAPALGSDKGVLCRFRDIVASIDLNVGTDEHIDPSFAKVANGVLFISGVGGMMSVDISDPSDPRPIGRWPAARVGDFAFVGTKAYAGIDGVGLVVLDWTDPATPQLRATLPYDDVAGVHAGPGLVLLSAQNALRVIDITDPDVPIETGSVSASSFTDVTRVGDYAYGLWRDHLQVYDLTVGQNPMYLDRLRVSSARRFAAGDGRLFVSRAQLGIAEIDISDPRHPAVLFQTQTPTLARDVAAAGDMILAADWKRGLLAYQATAPSEPELLGTFETPGSPSSVAMHANFAYLCHEDGVLRVIDLSRGYSMENSQELVDLTYAVDGGTVAAARAHLAVGGGVSLYNLDDPDGPALIHETGTLGSPRDVSVDGALAFVADYGAGLTVLDADTLHFVGNVDTPGQATSVATHGHYVYLATGSPGVQIVDVSNPAQPALIGAVDTPGSAIRVRVRGQRLIVAVGDGVTVLDLADPAAPAPLVSMPSPSATAADMEGDLLFVADGVLGLKVYDVSDPAHPVELDHEPNPGHIFTGMTIEPDRLLLTSRSLGVSVYERPSPGTLRLVGLAEEPGLVAIAASTELGVLTFGAGIWRLDLSDCPPCPVDLAPPAGVLNFFDLAAYLALYDASSPDADLAPPFGTINFFDIQAFLDQYNSGCP